MSDQQLTEEIKLIERLLNEGDQKILRKSSENILILGFTGSGKSTLLAFISNRESVGIENDYGERRIDEIPNSVRIGECTYWDCPGFKGYMSEAQEIANAYYMKKIFMNSDSIKFVLIMPYVRERQSRGEIIADLLDLLKGMIQAPETLLEGLCIVVTKCPPNYTKGHFLKALSEVTSQNNRCAEHRLFLDHIINNQAKIAFFRGPNNLDILNLDDQTEINACISRIRFVNTGANCSLSRNAQIYISKIMVIYQQHMLPLLIKFSNHLANKFNIETDINVLHRAMGVLNSIINNLQLEITEFTEFSRSLNTLIQFVNELPENISLIESLIFRIQFCQDLAVDGGSSFNILEWAEPLSKLKVQIQSSINMLYAAQRKREVEEYQAKNEDKIREFIEAQTPNELHNYHSSYDDDCNIF